MMKVGHLQFSEASGGFPNVSRTEVLLEQENNLFNQVLNRPETSPNTPNIVQPHQAMLNAQQCVWNWKIKTISWKNWPNNWIWWSFIREKKKLPARHKDFPANSVSTWPLYDSMNLGGIQSSAMARAIKLPKMVGASGVSRTKSSRFFIKKSNAERKNKEIFIRVLCQKQKI